MRLWMFKSTVLCLLIVALPICSGAGQQGELDAVLARLKSSAAATSSLSSHFIQEKHLAIFAETLLSQGRFVYQKPDRLRWELLTPVASGFVLNGGKGVRWNGLSGETGGFNIDQDPLMGMIAKQLLAWARLDTDWLQSRYRIELLSEQPVTFKLFPRDPGEAGFIASLQIRFAADLGYVETVTMSEQGGDETLLRFEEVRLNQKLPPDAFSAPEF